jgi:hypothetical protein
MNKHINKKDKYEIIKSPARHDVEVLHPVHKASPFISFNYSFKEISSDGSKTHIKSKRKSFENGKFESEEFEGTMPGYVYNNMVGEMQKLFFNQMKALMKPFSMFLPHWSKDREK